MRRFAGQGALLAGLVLSACILTPAGNGQTQGAILSLAGITEGSRVVLPPSISNTGLFVSASITGLGGAPQVEFALEWAGAVINRTTSGPPYAVAFSNLSHGKYFLSAHVVNSPEVATDVSFDILPASLRPENDLWSQALVITNVGAVAVGTNAYATRESGEPGLLPNAAGHSIWWSWRANTNGAVTVTTAGSRFDTVLAVYQGVTLVTLTLVGANDDAGPGSNTFSQVSFNAQGGINYYFSVDSAIAMDGSSAGGEARLRVVEATPPVISITAPEDGAGFLVVLPLATTNVSVAASISSPAGIERLQCSLDGDLPAPLTHVIQPPYQWDLANLSSGHYWLSVMAAGSNGLLAATHVGFSVVGLAPNVQLVDSPAVTPAGLQMAVTGLKGTNYTLQSSSNLIAWSELKRWTNFPGAERVSDINGLAAGTRFYRAAFP